MLKTYFPYFRLLSAVLVMGICGFIAAPSYAHPGHDEPHPLSPDYEYYESNPNQSAYETIAECAALFKIATEVKKSRRPWDKETQILFQKRVKTYTDGAVRIATKKGIANPQETVEAFLEEKYGLWKKRWVDSTEEKFIEMRQEHITWLNYCEQIGTTYFLQPR